MERNDLGTLQKHLSLFQENKDIEVEILYRLLSLELSKIAMEKNPTQNYQALQTMLKENEIYENTVLSFQEAKIKERN